MSIVTSLRVVIPLKGEICQESSILLEARFVKDGVRFLSPSIFQSRSVFGQSTPSKGFPALASISPRKGRDRPRCGLLVNFER